MLAFIAGLIIGLGYGMLCHFYRVPPWFMGNEQEEAMLLCLGKLERIRARIFTLQQGGAANSK